MQEWLKQLAADCPPEDLAQLERAIESGPRKEINRMNDKELRTFLDQCEDLDEGESINITAQASGFLASMWLTAEDGTASQYHSGHGYTVAGALDQLYTNVERNLSA